MRKKSLLLCLLLAGTARGDNPLPRILCNGVFQGFPASLNFQGATCTGIGGINAITVSPGTGPAGPAGPTGATGPTGPAGAPGGAPTGATYITQVPDGTLSAEQAMSLLPTGLVKSTTATGVLSIYAGTSCAYAIQALDASGAASTCRAAPTIPTDLSAEPFITKTASANLSNEFALGSLANGLLLNATTTGVPTIYAGTSCPYAVKTLDVSGASTCTAAPTIPTDISAASYWTRVSEANLSSETALGSLATGAILNTGVTGVPTIYAGTSCTNQFNRSLNASIAATCSGVGVADFTPNQGTTTQVLHGNAAGQPSFGAVSLTADVSGITPLANGGTNANLTASNGAIPYSDASKFVLLGPGTVGQVLFSGGAGAPTWGSVWKFLGTATGATVTVGPITWTDTTRYVMCSYQITNYNGGTPVGRFLMGTASISTTARTNSYAISEGVTAPTTASGATATPGIPLAVTLSNVGRMGTIFIDGASGSVKTVNVLGQNQTPAVATVPTIFQGASFFSDLGTNLAITRAQLTVYDTLVAIAASAQTFSAGTRLTCWGRDTL